MSAEASARRVPVGPARAVWYPRLAVLGLALAAVGAWAASSLLRHGSYPLSAGDVWLALTQRDDSPASTVVWNLRMPRVITGALTGACLGVSGLLFQGLSRNALGSPEIIGMVTGASLGATLGITLLGTHGVGTAACAVVGCVMATLLGYGLARGSALNMHRFLLVGVGLSALWSSLTTLLLTRSLAEIAISAQIWLVGTLNARTWEHVMVPAGALLLLLPVAYVLPRHLTALELGTDMATQLGVPMRALGGLVGLVGVVLTAAAVAATGPLSFVALAAPHLARTLAGPGVVPLVTSALAGATLLLSAEWLLQVLPGNVQAPVGLATSVLGGLYLVLVVLRQSR